MPDRPQWKLICQIGFVVLSVAVLFCVSVWARGTIDLDTPNEALCPQANALRTARLLDKAEKAYANADAHGQSCTGLGAAEINRAQAEKHFAVAGVYAAASPVPTETPAGQAPKPGQPDLGVLKANSKKAIDEFADGLSLNPFDSSANLGLTLELKKGLVAPSQECATAANLVNSGLLGVAGVALSRGLERNDETCVETVPLLREKLTVASVYLRQARRESDKDGARDTYAKALLANANLSAARTGLEGSLDDDSRLDKVEAWLAEVPNTLKTALAWLIPLAVVLLLCALGIWIAVRELSAHWRWARRLFEWLGRHPGFAFIYHAAVPDIKIEPFDGKGEDDLAGADFSKLLTAEMGRQVGRDPAFPFDRIVKGPAPDSGIGDSVADLLSEIPATKVLGSVFRVVSKLFRRRTILLTGHLTPASDEGAGVFLSVEGSRRDLNKSFTVRERDYDPKPGEKGSPRWLRLIPAAGVWARWHLQAAQDPTTKLKRVMWRADALFQTAQAWELKGDWGRAETLYVEALEQDPTLLPASHNLAILEIRNRKYRRASELERALRTKLHPTADDDKAATLTKQWPTLDTASLYTSMLALAYPAIDRRPTVDGWAGNTTLAIKKGRELVTTLAHELEPTDLNRKRKKKEAKRDPSIAEQLTLAELPSIVVLASLAVRFGEDQKDQIEKAIQCALAYAGKDELGVDKDELGVEKISRRNIYERQARQKPWQLVHGYVLQGEKNLSRRTHYNLACYFTTLLTFIVGEEDEQKERRAKIQQLALNSLDLALVGGYLVEWAPKDPSLMPLWTARKNDLTKILKAHTIRPRPQT